MNEARRRRRRQARDRYARYCAGIGGVHLNIRWTPAARRVLASSHNSWASWVAALDMLYNDRRLSEVAFFHSIPLLPPPDDAPALGVVAYDEPSFYASMEIKPRMDALLEQLTAILPEGYTATYEFTEMVRDPHAGRLDLSRPCPYDTNGDGDCGRPACPFCGVDTLAARLAARRLRGGYRDMWSGSNPD